MKRASSANMLDTKIKASAIIAANDLIQSLYGMVNKLRRLDHNRASVNAVLCYYIRNILCNFKNRIRVTMSGPGNVARLLG